MDKKPDLKVVSVQKKSEDQFEKLYKTFLAVFRRLGGVSGMIKWINKDKINEREYYRTLFRMLEKVVAAKIMPDGGNDKDKVEEALASAWQKRKEK